MGAIDEIIDAPLSPEGLGERFRELCDHPRFANLPGKIEPDVWGRIVMSPASNLHGMLQMRLGKRLAPLGGEAFAEASVLTPIGVLVADVAWGSVEFLRAHRDETRLTRAPEICIEMVSPSNARKKIEEKIAAYLAAGAEGVDRPAEVAARRGVRAGRGAGGNSLRGGLRRAVPRVADPLSLSRGGVDHPHPDPPPARGEGDSRSLTARALRQA